MPGTDILETEVTNVSRHGLWLLTAAGERFLAFDDYPWFRDAPIAHVLNVQEPSPGHYHWPDLDVDLSWKIIERPHDYPLKSVVMK
ncbi:MAG: DUF2442 domain-containing protein [Hyphomicrobium sp.]